jgi:hypothetical protein
MLSESSPITSSETYHPTVGSSFGGIIGPAAFIFHLRGDTKIGQLHDKAAVRVISVYKNVTRFDVAVDDFSIVKVCHAI